MSIIANTTVISNFASMGQLGLLRQLYGTLYLSTEVYQEMRVGLEEGYQFQARRREIVRRYCDCGGGRCGEEVSQLVAQRPAKVVAIHEGKVVFVGDLESEVYQHIREAGLEPMPLVFRVPRKEDLQSIL